MAAPAARCWRTQAAATLNEINSRAPWFPSRSSPGRAASFAKPGCAILRPALRCKSGSVAVMARHRPRLRLGVIPWSSDLHPRGFPFVFVRECKVQRVSGCASDPSHCLANTLAVGPKIFPEMVGKCIPEASKTCIQVLGEIRTPKLRAPGATPTRCG